MRAVKTIFLTLLCIAILAPVHAEARSKHRASHTSPGTQQVSISGVQKKLQSLLESGDAKKWDEVLSPDFQTGFGDTLNDDAAKDEFEKKITGDESYKEDFGKIIGGKCGADPDGAMVCPASWLKCEDDDTGCGPEPRLIIDRTASSWQVSFYGNGD